MNNKPTSAELELMLKDLPGWSHENDALTKSFTFASFRDAISFIVRVAFEAEEMDHHPEIHNVYNKLKITLRTHDAGNVVTEKDLMLAAKIETLNTNK
ncbi:MAG: 4a-hydroxytetrahydrobiopterin dehydratase [Opitutales bacterium]|nr:4a-hydroxytetrahydrobiopterin dehydratase [Opitutales bacterium]